MALPRNSKPNGICGMNEYGIYYILNLHNDRIYVGQTGNLWMRMRQHYRRLTTNHHPNKLLQHDWNTCGENAYEFGVLTTIDKRALDRDETLERLERLFTVKVYQSDKPQFGYNIPSGTRVLIVNA